MGADDVTTRDDVLASARADLAEGREWQAREALATRVAQDYDPEALELLGEVHEAMRDLPAAGAAWFGTSRRGADVDTAVAAWRERYADDFPQMWRSLPAPVRDHEGNKRVDALRRRAAAARSEVATASAEAGNGSAGDPGDSGEGIDAAVVIAIVLAVLFVVFAVIGFVWVLAWLVP